MHRNRGAPRVVYGCFDNPAAGDPDRPLPRPERQGFDSAAGLEALVTLSRISAHISRRPPSNSYDPHWHRYRTAATLPATNSGRFVPARPSGTPSTSPEGSMRSRGPRTVLLVVTAAILLAATPRFARAQSDTGVIDGRVLDESKAALPGVTLTARNIATGFTRSAASSAIGTYRLEFLPPGPVRGDGGTRQLRHRSGQGHRRAGRHVVHGRFRDEGRRRDRDPHRERGFADGADDEVRRGPGHQLVADREHAAQRPQVPGSLAARARHAAIELLRSDQDRGRRHQLRWDDRPLGQHHGRRRRQQRRRGSRAAAAVQRRGDPGIQGHDRTLQRRVRTVDRRRRERRDEERHEHASRQRLPVRAGSGAELADILRG